MKISFYSNRIFFNGDTLEKNGIGGSESSLINLTKSLKKQNPEFEITVYNGNERKTEDFDGVIYKSAIDFKLECRTFRQDIFIILRDIFPLNEKYIDSKKIIFWSQDDMNELDLQKIRDDNYIRERIDLFLAISEYAKKEIQNGFPEKRIEILRNGYREDLINNQFKPKINNSCVYCSTPFRGLNILAEIWPAIYQGCLKNGIHTDLKIFSGMSLYQQSDNNFIELYKTINNLENAHIFSPVSQKELYKELSNCKVLTYTNNFLETGCVAVTDALANNVWTITTDLGALGEQVKDNINGNLIKGDPNSNEYKDQFIKKTIDAVCCKNLMPNSNGLIFSWEYQAKKLKNIIKEMI